ncbi:hypothetical protein ASD13_08120 [Microbacterium sp. Root1433D1]|uniref:hypothetical protein n=1 Tax=Microbacterium sp. Root1433D1 TaxID=1736463 RepID=UPI00070031A3|nr:hypothetical protein [Microbacterium sp. Root1433D1]KQY76162.1 hypothetical protein ASD13_08120 [Microbacterium sp. Root1433D1]
MKPFKPWDATDDEYADLLIIREPIPDSLDDTIRQWLETFFRQRTNHGAVRREVINTIEAALRVKLDRASDHPSHVTESIRGKGDKYTLRVVDFLLSQMQQVDRVRDPYEVALLKSQMVLSSSAVQVVREGANYRLARRMPEGIEDAAQRAINDANGTAGQHLATAWREMQSLSPNASMILREGIQAVEAAAGAVVIPKDKKPQLSKIVGALRDQKGWGLVLAQRDDGHPDHKTVLIGMLETLAFAEQHRHSGHGYSETEAVGHVQLAATLVGWFSAGVVVRSG